MVNFTTIANLASLTVDEAQEPKCGRWMDRLVRKEVLEFVESLLASAILDEHALYYNCDCYLGTKGLAGQGGSVQISRRKKFQHKAEGILVEREAPSPSPAAAALDRFAAGGLASTSSDESRERRDVAIFVY